MSAIIAKNIHVFYIAAFSLVVIKLGSTLIFMYSATCAVQTMRIFVPSGFM